MQPNVTTPAEAQVTAAAAVRQLKSDKAVMKKVMQDLRAKQEAVERHIYHKKRQRSIRAANRWVLQQAGAQQGLPSGALAVAKHVLHGTVTHPDLVQQAHVFHHAKMAAPAVSRGAARSYPWHSGPDSFTTAARGKAETLAPRLTWELFNSCLRQTGRTMVMSSQS